MKKEEICSDRIAGAFDNGNENRGEFVALVSQWLELLGGREATFHQQFQPVCRLFQFSQ